jgi:hypothetical protein
MAMSSINTSAYIYKIFDGAWVFPFVRMSAATNKICFKFSWIKSDGCRGKLYGNIMIAFFKFCDASCIAVCGLFFILVSAKTT